MSSDRLEITVHVVPSRALLPPERSRVENQLKHLLGRTGICYQLWFYPHADHFEEPGPVPEDRIAVDP